MQIQDVYSLEGACKRDVKNAIKIYNNKRTHIFLDFKIPDMVYNLNLY